MHQHWDRGAGGDHTLRKALGLQTKKGNFSACKLYYGITKEQFSDFLFQLILSKTVVRPWKRHGMYVRKKSSKRIEIDKEKSNIDGGSEKAKALRI